MSLLAQSMQQLAAESKDRASASTATKDAALQQQAELYGAVIEEAQAASK